MGKYKNIIFVTVIIFITIILRFVFFGVSPPALNWDEASLGYNAYSILKTGKDEWGRFLPLTFEAFGDYKLPVYVYSLVPIVYLFDLTEQAVRLPSQLGGVLSILLLYLIVKRLFKNEVWALFSAFLLAVSPWHIFLSRIALEANLALFLFLLGFYLFLKRFENKWFLVLAAIFFGLTLFTYNSARVFVPLFLLGNFFIFRKEILKFKFFLILPTLVLSIFVFYAGFLAVFEDSSSRYFWVSILDEGAINRINELRGSANLPPALAKLTYNKVTYFASNFLVNYLSHFSPEFLFIKGGSNHQFSVPNNGLIYWVELPFLLMGLYQLFRLKFGKVVIWWLILAPIPAAITRESPHVLRAIFMLGPLQIITAFGLVKSFEYFKGKIVAKTFYPLIVVVLFLSLSYYMDQYFFVYPRENSESWQYGIKEALVFVNTKENLNNRPLFITKKYGEPHIFYLFYNKYDPAKYQNSATLIRYKRSNWRWVDRLDNVYFVNDWDMKEKLKDQHGYVISTPGNYPGIPPILKSVNFLDGKGALEVVEI